MYKAVRATQKDIILEPLNLRIFVSSVRGFNFLARNKSESPKSPNFLLIFISIGLAILVKGGGGAVVPLLTIIFFTYLNKERDFLKKLKIKQYLDPQESKYGLKNFKF